jgi:hypothetical protein
MIRRKILRLCSLQDAKHFNVCLHFPVFSGEDSLRHLIIITSDTEVQGNCFIAYHALF